MAKAPAFQFYPSDWQRDLSEHPLEIEGAWIRICCAIWWSETPGTATKPLTNWARVLRVGEKKSLSIIQYLLNQNIADVIIQNSTITITSRRMVHDEHIRNIRRCAGSKGGNPAIVGHKKVAGLDKQNLVNQNPTPSSSSSSSDLKPPISPKGKSVESDAFKEFWGAYPRRTAKPAALKAWIKHVDESKLQPVMDGVRRYAAECVGRDQQYIAHPATWLNNRRWEDEINAPHQPGEPKPLTKEQLEALVS